MFRVQCMMSAVVVEMLEWYIAAGSWQLRWLFEKKCFLSIIACFLCSRF
jgi:hypothetical protein